MFKHSRLGTKITLSVSLILVALLFSSAAAFVYYEHASLKKSYSARATQVLQILEATHTQAMLNRGNKEDINPVMDAFNETLGQLTETSTDMTVWLVMGPKVLDFQKKSGLFEVEPPQDDFDHRALRTKKPVSGFIGDRLFRMTTPVVLGQGNARHEACFACHGKDMGMKEGGVIGAFSIGLDIRESQDGFFRLAFAAFSTAFFVSVVVLLFTSGVLRRLVGAPIARMTRIMEDMAGGDVDVEIPNRDRDDEIGAMARALDVFKGYDLERRKALGELKNSRNELETRVVERTQEVEEKGQRLTAIMENAAEGIITADENGLIESFNPMAEHLFGYKADEVIGKNLSMLMVGHDKKHHNAYVESYKATGVGKILGVRERELKALRKNGEMFDFELNVAEFTLDGVRHFLGTIRDVSKRKAFERENNRRQEFQNLLQAVVQAANESRTVDVAIKACLSEVCSLMGWPLGHVFLTEKGNPNRLASSEVWHFDDPYRFEAFKKATEEIFFDKGVGIPGQVLATGKSVWVSELAGDPTFPRRLAAEKIGLVSGMAFPIPVNGKVGAVLEFFADTPMPVDNYLLWVLNQIGIQLGQVIERNQALEQLADAMEETAKANQAKTEFLANMSHELRTPLNSIIGFSEVIGNETFGPLQNDRYREYMRDIHGSGKHLLELINDILDVSKVEAGAMELVDEAIDVEEVVADALRLLQGRADDARIMLKAEIDDGLPGLRADLVRVKQILLNLLSNAVKFTPLGGSVTVDARLDGDGNMLISVIDTGIGIAEDEIEKMFQPFTQASSGFGKRHEGTGLGLYLVKSLVDEHGGTMKIESKLGHGTKVSIIFPPDRVLGAKAEPEPKPAPESKAG